MSQIPLTVWWLIPVLPIALAVAWNDMARMKIPNGLVYALAFTYILTGALVLPIDAYLDQGFAAWLKRRVSQQP